MPVTVTCTNCAATREASDDELRAYTVPPCACGNGTYRGINWNTYTPPQLPPEPEA